MEKKSAEHVKFSAFARRKGSIKVLDKLIESYHISNLDKIQRSEFVIRIMNQAFVHMVTEPNSDRKLAVKALAQISYNRAKQLTEENDKEKLAQALAQLPQSQLVRQSLEVIGEDDDMDVECSENGDD